MNNHLYFRIDYNGDSGIRGRYGCNAPLIINLIPSVIRDALAIDPKYNRYNTDPESQYSMRKIIH